MPKETRKGKVTKKVASAASSAPYKKGGNEKSKGGKGGKGVKGEKKSLTAYQAWRLNESEKKKPYEKLFESKPKVFGIGRNSPYVGSQLDLSRMVKWPKMIKLQRKKRVLMHRLKVPPTINQFTHTLGKNDAVNLFKLMAKYKPEEKKAKKQRLFAVAKAKANNEPYEAPKKPSILKFGLSNVTSIVERGEAGVVVIAHDVDPIELVIWLPTLCRKANVPYCIVKGKSRLGQLVHKKTATCLCLREKDIRKEDQHDFSQLIQTIKSQFNDKWASLRKVWGGMKLGQKARAAASKRERLAQKQEKARAAAARQLKIQQQEEHVPAAAP